MHRRRTLNASKIEASAGFLLLSPSYGESGRREEPCNTSAPLGYPRGVMPVHVVQHPLVEDVLARLRDKTTPSEEFRRLTHRVALLLVAEATRDLPLRDVTTRWWPRAGRRPWRSSSAAPRGPPALDRGGARRGLHGGPGVPERPQVHPARPRRLRRPPVRHVASPIALTTLRRQRRTARLDSITITGAVSRR